MYTATDVMIMNRALMRTGQPYDQVTAVDGTDLSKWGAWAALEFQATRNEELIANEWLFAVKRASLGAAVTVTNNTGTFYAYTIPADLLFTCFLYTINPSAMNTYPLEYASVIKEPYIHEDYFYTNTPATTSGPYVKYIREIPLGYSWTQALFVDALVMRLASKILPPATANVANNGIATAYLQEYAGILSRAKGKNALDREDDIQGEGRPFVSDRTQWMGNVQR